MNKRYLILTIIISLLIITQTGCSKEAEPVSADNYYLDTTCNITVYGTGEYGTAKADGEPSLDEDVANEAIDKAYELCAELDKTLSRTTKVSDIYRINHAGGEWVEVSDFTIELINKAVEYSELSDGRFDLTVGGITEQWDFHAEDPVLPDDDKIDAAVQHIDYRNVEIEGNRVRLADADSKIDLGGIAKGYIGDRMADCLIENGVNSAIVNLGGNIICIGSKSDGTDFNIGIETPYSDRSEISGSINVSDKTVVTSGVYERYFELNGRKYHHILSTDTGYPVETDIVAVTLVADIGRSVDIDALGTICLIMGSEEGIEFVEGLDGIEAVFTLTDGSEMKTSGMELEEE